MAGKLLSDLDRVPVERIDGRPEVPLLVICDHAGNEVPRALNGLGIDHAELRRHIGWDIGARNVAERIIERTGATGVLSAFSRLVIDCNRPLSSATLAPEVSDGTVIPANRGLSAQDVGRRIEEIYLPYHLAIADALGRFAACGQQPFVLSVHSCTPQLNGVRRPWAIGIAHSEDERASRPFLEAVARLGDFKVGDNEPYAVDETDYSIPAHALGRGLRHVLIEIRQDQIADDAGAAMWADRVCAALNAPGVLHALK